MFKLSKTQKFYSILLIILLASIFLRFFNLTDSPLGLNQDEAVNGVDAYYLANFGKDHRDNFAGPFLQSFDDWVSPILTYTTIPFVKLFGLSHYLIRSVTAIHGVFAIIILYFTTKLLRFNRTSSILTVSAFAFSPFMIHISRWAIPPAIVPFWVGLLVFVQILVFKSKGYKRYGLLILSALIAAVLTYTYPTMKLFAPLYYFAFCVLLLIQSLKISDLKNRIKLKQVVFKIIKSGYPYLLFLISVAPIFILTLINPEKYNNRFDSTSISSTGQNPVLGFTIRYISYFTPVYFFTPSDPNTMHRPNFFGLLNIGFIILYIMLCYQAYKNRRLIILFIKEKYQKVRNGFLKEVLEKSNNFYIYWLLAIGLFLGPVASSLTKDYLMSLRTIHFLYFSILGFGIYLDYLLKNNFKKKNLLIKSISALIVLNTAIFGIIYFTFYPQSSSVGFRYGNRQVIEYFDQNQEKYTVGIIDMMPIYEFYNFLPDLKDIDQDNRGLIKDKKYKFEYIDLSNYEEAQNINELKFNDNVSWDIYESVDEEENITWLAKKRE